jgi:polyhydroxyalkanoate synthesis regulator phasin
MKLSMWLARRRAETLRRWRHDQISLVQAVRELVHEGGMSAEQAWDLVQRT